MREQQAVARLILHERGDDRLLERLDTVGVGALGHDRRVERLRRVRLRLAQVDLERIFARSPFIFEKAAIGRDT